MTELEKKKLADIINPLYQSAISHPNSTLGWKPGAGSVNFINSLIAIGVDFSKVDLTQ